MITEGPPLSSHNLRFHSACEQMPPHQPSPVFLAPWPKSLPSVSVGLAYTCNYSWSLYVPSFHNSKPQIRDRWWDSPEELKQELQAHAVWIWIWLLSEWPRGGQGPALSFQEYDLDYTQPAQGFLFPFIPNVFLLSISIGCFSFLEIKLTLKK